MHVQKCKIHHSRALMHLRTTFFCTTVDITDVKSLVEHISKVIKSKSLNDVTQWCIDNHVGTISPLYRTLSHIIEMFDVEKKEKNKEYKIKQLEHHSLV